MWPTVTPYPGCNLNIDTYEDSFHNDEGVFCILARRWGFTGDP